MVKQRYSASWQLTYVLTYAATTPATTEAGTIGWRERLSLPILVYIAVHLSILVLHEGVKFFLKWAFKRLLRTPRNLLKTIVITKIESQPKIRIVGHKNIDVKGMDIAQPI